MNERDTNADKKLKAVFDESVDAMDAATLSRLNRGRQAALAELSRPRRQWSRWMPATGVAAAVLLSVILLQGPRDIAAIAEPVSVSDMEILLGEDSIEMLEELEFFSWIDVADTEADVG